MDYRSQQNLSPGVRNNNPGNIKFDGTAWQGMAGDDGTFVIFVDTVWGIRALAVDLTTKINKDGLDTITNIITQYAPAVENDPSSYIAAVAAQTGLDQNQQLTADSGTLTLLVNAIIDHELGQSVAEQYISDADIAQGVSMAQGGPAVALQAATVYAQQNPLQAVIIGAVVVGACILIFD
jgi:hypothetical protein